tara:strand:- start:372 stop:608 length:237 start_codon:yes stop_codon:yes gene_type:complete
MKLLKFIPLLLVLTLFNSNAYAAKDCDEIKGNIVGKLFCKAKSNIDSESSGSEASSSTEEKNTGWKIWKKPEWMKKKN